MLLYPQSSPQPHAYTPTRPSPLAVSASGTTQSPFTFAMSPSSSPSSTPSPQTAPHHRPYKPNTLLTRTAATDASRATRRDMFLKKVAHGRAERLWEGRAEQIMLLDHAKARRQWEAQLELEAPAAAPYDSDSDEDVDADAENRDPRGGSATRTKGGERVPLRVRESEVEALARLEGEEIEAMVAMMEEEDGEDDEYDGIFWELERRSQQGAQAQAEEGEDCMMDDVGGEAMDMS